jgi:hypothetical protein
MSSPTRPERPDRAVEMPSDDDVPGGWSSPDSTPSLSQSPEPTDDDDDFGIIIIGRRPRRYVVDEYAVKAIEAEYETLSTALVTVPWDAPQRTAIENRLAAMRWMAQVIDPEWAVES